MNKEYKFAKAMATLMPKLGRTDIRDVAEGDLAFTAFELGEKVERERIIKLLEEMAKSTFAGDVWHINPFDYAIALIKGDNNA